MMGQRLHSLFLLMMILLLATTALMGIAGKKADGLVCAAMIALLLVLWMRKSREEEETAAESGTREGRGEIVEQFLTDSLRIAIVSVAISSILFFLFTDKIGLFLMERLGEAIPEQIVKAADSTMVIAAETGVRILCIAVIAVITAVCVMKKRGAGKREEKQEEILQEY